METQSKIPKMDAETVTSEPPPKKQKTEHARKSPLMPPSRKSPETIDLTSLLCGPVASKEQQRLLNAILKVFRNKKKIVVVAGAGISVRAGIPDFRSADGLFSSLRTDHKLKSSGKELFDAAVYRDNELTSSFHDMVRNLDSMVKKATPTAFHHLLASLAQEGRLLRLYSQNVDCIENQLPPLQTRVPLGNKGPWPKTIQLHGGLEKMVCSKCGWLGGFDAELFVGSEPPDCSECVEMESVRGVVGKRSLGVGKLRPRIVLYNEFHPDSEAIGSVSRADLKTRPDAIIVVGTSLKVPGIKRIVREMCKSVQDMRGGVTMWVNPEDPPLGKDLEGLFDYIVKGDCETIASLVALPRWDGSSPEPSTGSTTPDFIEVSQFPSPSPYSQPEVLIQNPPVLVSVPPSPPASKRKDTGERNSKAVREEKKEAAPKKPRAPRKPKANTASQATLVNTFKVAKAPVRRGKKSKVIPNIPTPPPTDMASSSPTPIIGGLENSISVRPTTVVLPAVSA